MSNRRTFPQQTAAISSALGLSPLAKLPLDTDEPLPQSRTSTRAAQRVKGRINGLSMKREAEVLAALKEELAKRAR